MRRKENKKLKWTKPYLASFGNIADTAIGYCALGSNPDTEDPACKNGPVATGTCSTGGSIMGTP